MTAKRPVHQWQLRLRIGDGDDTVSREAAARREAEAVRRNTTRQPAGANKEEGSRMDACGGCSTKGDLRWRHEAMRQPPANEKQTGGEAPVDKRRRGLNTRPRLHV